MALTFRTFNVEKLRLSTKGQIETLNMGNSVLIGQGAGNSDDLSDNRNILIGNLTNTGAGNEQNVIIGHTAYTTANNTTTIGYAAISGANNAVVYGHSAQATGIQSMAIGNLAIVNTLGAMAIGKSANAQGDYGIALGNTAYTNNVRGIALGAEANSQALNGIAIGYQSYSTNPNTISIGTLASAQSERGIAIGYDSYTGNQFTTAIGNNAEAQGNNSIAIGSASRTYAATSTAVGNAATANGTNATAFGNSANANSGDATALGNGSFANGANGTAIGNGASCAGNQVRIGNNAVTSIGGFANWTNVSDARVKTNIKKNIPGLNFIIMLEPVSYNLDLEAINRIQRKNSPTFSTADSVKMKEIQTGFLAQDVEKAAKSINYEFSGVDAPDNENDTYGIRYAEFVVPLVKGMQEQQQLILEMKKEIENLKKEILITKQK